MGRETSISPAEAWLGYKHKLDPTKLEAKAWMQCVAHYTHPDLGGIVRFVSSEVEQGEGLAFILGFNGDSFEGWSINRHSESQQKAYHDGHEIREEYIIN